MLWVWVVVLVVGFPLSLPIRAVTLGPTAEMISSTWLVLLVAVPITALWTRGMWRHFFRPPEDADFDWGMTHGFHVSLGGCLTAIIGLLFVTILFGN
jgi:hypothetical protein